MILAEGHWQDCLDLLRGGASHSDLGRGLYATHAPLASVILPSRLIHNPAFPADRFSDSILTPAGHEFIRNEQHQTARQSELHEQRHLCEQQRADCSATRELLWPPTRSHRAVSRWKLQLQPEPTRHLFSSRRCCQVALNPAPDGPGLKRSLPHCLELMDEDSQRSYS
jgi:hypothetical protein